MLNLCLGKNYQNATAFVITFVVNNHLDEKKKGMAEAWEAEFIKLMKNYKNDKMTVSFSSEVCLVLIKDLLSSHLVFVKFSP